MNTLIWGMFVSVTLNAAVHLGNAYLDNLHSTKNLPQRTMKQLFDVTRKLVKEQTEIQGVSMINWQEKFWEETTLLTARAVQLSTAKAYVFSDSVLCMERMSENRLKAVKEKIDWFVNSPQCRELNRNRRRADGVRVEKISQDSLHCRFLAEIQNMMTEIQCEPDQFPGRIIFMSMYNDIVWEEKGDEELCIANSQIVADYARRFAHGHWSFLGLGSEKKWYGTHTKNPDGKWDRVAEDMMLNFSESGHTVFRESSALERGDLKSKGKGTLSMRFCGDDNTAEVVLRSIISVNQLSIYGAVADMCDELACRISDCSESTGKPVAQDNPETMARNVDNEQITSD